MIRITTETETYDVQGRASDVLVERTGLHIMRNGQTIATFKRWTNWMELPDGEAKHG